MWPGISLTRNQVIIYPRGTMRLSVTGTGGYKIDSSQLTWVNESPDILQLNEDEPSIYTLREGTGYLTVYHNGYSDRMTVYVVPTEDQINLATLAVTTTPNFTGTTQLYVFSSSRFYGQNYTVSWSVDNPSVATIEPYTQDGEHYVRFYTHNFGSALITCRVTLPDGSYAQNYCQVNVFYE